MRLPRTTHGASVQHRQIGRKALQADRLSHALNGTRRKNTKFTLRLPSMRPKTIAMVCLIVAGVSLVGFGGTQFYLSQLAVAQKAEAAKQQSKLEAKSLAADACRRKKVEQKSDQIGKITFDELYDHGECDK